MTSSSSNDFARPKRRVPAANAPTPNTTAFFRPMRVTKSAIGMPAITVPAAYDPTISPS